VSLDCLAYNHELALQHLCRGHIEAHPTEEKAFQEEQMDFLPTELVYEDFVPYILSHAPKHLVFYEHYSYTEEI
jgi:hypothetical protein